MDLELEQQILNNMRDIERYDEDSFEEENPEKETVLSLSEENAIERCLNDLELSTADMNLFHHILSGKQRTFRDFRDQFRDLTDIETDSGNVDSTLPHPAEQSSNYFKVLLDKATDIFNAVVAKGCEDIKKSEKDKDNNLGNVDLAKVMDEVEEIEQHQLIYNRNGASTSNENMPFVIITTNRADNDTANDVTNSNERSKFLNPSTTVKEVTLTSRNPYVSVTSNKPYDEKRANDVTFINEKSVNDASTTGVASNYKRADVDTNGDNKKQSFCNILQDSRSKWMDPTSSHVTRPKMRVAKRKVLREAENKLDKTHIYSFFSSMADQVSTLPYDSTLTAKSKVTSLLEDMVKKLKDWNEDSSSHKPMQGHELSEEDLDFITMKLSRLPYVY